MKLIIKVFTFISIIYLIQSCFSNSKREKKVIKIDNKEAKFNEEEEFLNINKYVVEKQVDSISYNNFKYWLKDGKIIKLKIVDGDGENYIIEEDYYLKDGNTVFAYQKKELNFPNAIDYKALIYFDTSKIIKEQYWIDNVKTTKRAIEEQLNRIGSTIQDEIINDKETNRIKGLLKLFDLSNRYGFEYKRRYKNESSSNICSICGNKFHNRGYEEVSEGVWEELVEGNQGQICSPACGRKHNQQFNDVAKKYGVDLDDSGTNYNNDGQYRMGNDGRVYEQNKCSLCKGTGIETGRNVANGETESRICPMCEGRGVRSY